MTHILFTVIMLIRKNFVCPPMMIVHSPSCLQLESEMLNDNCRDTKSYKTALTIPKQQYYHLKKQQALAKKQQYKKDSIHGTQFSRRVCSSIYTRLPFIRYCLFSLCLSVPFTRESLLYALTNILTCQIPNKQCKVQGAYHALSVSDTLAAASVGLPVWFLIDQSTKPTIQHAILTNSVQHRDIWHRGHCKPIQVPWTLWIRWLAWHGVRTQE